MKCIKISTEKYQAKLENFAIAMQEKKICTVSDFTLHAPPIKFSWTKVKHNEVLKAIMFLLHTLAAFENPVYKHSPKLITVAVSIICAQTYKQDMVNLTSCITKAEVINIDGYITFRLNEYMANLDTMLYTIMRKSPLISEL